MLISTVIFVFCFIWILYKIAQNEYKRLKNLKTLENSFLIGMIWTETYKFQMQEMLRIIYDKASETDPQFLKDYEKIVEVTNKKVSDFADEWIKHMNEVLEHKTEYQNWQEATKYIERILKANGNEKKFTERN